MNINFLNNKVPYSMHCFQEVLEAVKPKKTKLGAPVESESMRRATSGKLVADASLVEENENETGLAVEIEVVTFPYSFSTIFTWTIFAGAKPWDARQSEEHGKSDLQSRVGA